MRNFTKQFKNLRGFKCQLRRLLLTGLQLLCLISVATYASAKSKDGKITTEQKIFQGRFFEQYRPQNALEMIQRLPGFNFDQGENNRGFSGNAGNVLIDKARPTSKSGGLVAALVRIPAAQVDYIEILRGGLSASDSSGQSVVANVVRKKEGSSGTWAAKLRRSPEGRYLPNIEAAFNTTIDDWKAAFDTDIGGFPGYRTAVIEDRDPDGLLNSSADETFSHNNKWLFVNGEGSRATKSGLLTLNARLATTAAEFDTGREMFSSRLPDNTLAEQRLDIDETFDTEVGELGVDWTSSSDDWKLHLLGLTIMNQQQYANQVSFETRIDENINQSKFSQDADKTEIIARATYGFVGNQDFKPEYGIELANNKLVSDASYFENGVAIELSGANVEVEEIRSEIFASFTYKASDNISLEAGITGEFSQIEVSGEDANKQTFQLLKPRLSVNYKLNESHRLSITAERKVGQLNFRDFAASNDAADNNIFSGNPDLAPDLSDELSAIYDWSFSERGSLKLKAFHHWKKDILEQIILSSGGQGLGNAGDAKFWGIETDLNLPLDWVLENGLIEISHVYKDSEFTDPIIGKNRNINNYTHNWLTFQLRQDLVDSRFAWGIEYRGIFTNTNYTVNERVTFRGNDRFKAFVETSKYWGVKIQLEVNHLNTGDYTRSRFIHSGNRGEPLDRTQVAYRHREPEFKLSVSGTF